MNPAALPAEAEAAAAVLEAFHPAVAAWFRHRFAAPTAAQMQAWPAIRAGEATLVAAPTGSGKTLTAFLAAIDALVREGVARGGTLPDETRVVYVSPLKALSNDIHINLEEPLEGIRAELEKLGLPDVAIRTAVRTGDTPQRERLGMRRQPPHILVTTPESLYILLGSESGRAMLGTARTVIVDEIHAVAASKRGAHLALSLERLDALCGQPLRRIGLSATQKPIEAVARFLVGAPRQGEHDTRCTIIDVGHQRPRDLGLSVPPVPLEAVMSNDGWELIYNQLATLIESHRTTLVFVNTRRMAERLTRHLSERLGKQHVAAHHGSLAKEQRLDAEQRLKRGELSALVATASLELGIDIGDVDLVCQIGSPRSIAAFLQRAGRSGHAVIGTPKARLFPTTRDELVECAALLDCVRRGELDTLTIPPQPLDVLAQQIVAEVACREWSEDALYTMVRGADPYRALPRDTFDALVRMLAEGYSTRRGPREGYLHRDATHGVLRARRGARLTALTSGGAIPDTADYAVVLEPQGTVIGSVHEDFAVESLAGDIFQLGNTSYRIQRVEQGRLRVEDAHGMPPSIPFWLGEAPGRSDALSFGVSRLREEISALLEPSDEPLSPRERGRGEGTPEARATPEPSPPAPLPRGEGSSTARAVVWLRDTLGLTESAAQQMADYLAAAKAALGVLPTQSTIVFERFFDESGGTQLVIHAPFGSRINRAWGLALRKRFCRQFNFELQAAATEDAIVLSLSTSHSFPLEEVARYLHSASADHVLTQALLDAPLFGARWRWNAVTALALPRFRGGKKTPPQLQRMKSEDLLATVFPDQVACLENIVGEREIPDHPLVAQTLHDCLREAMDLDGLLGVLRGLESGAIRVVARDLTGPSPLASEVLTAAPYAFLDDAPLEERRTQAAGRWNPTDNAADLGTLDPAAIDAVRDEAWPQVRSADEMHEALDALGAITAAEVAQHGWSAWIDALEANGRVTRLTTPLSTALAPSPPLGGEGWGEGAAVPAVPAVPTLHTTTEKLPLWLAIHPQASVKPAVTVPPAFASKAWTRDDALREAVRGRLLGTDPITVAALAATLAVAPQDIDQALLRLQTEGYVIQGRFTPQAQAADAPMEWCERHLLVRIHRYTLGRLRREIEPVSRRDLMRFLFDWQHLTSGTRRRGPDALTATLAQLEGFEAAAGAWETELLPARIEDYSSTWLDELCRAGRIGWSRLRAASGGGNGPVRSTPIVLLPRRQLAVWTAVAERDAAEPPALSSRAQAVADALRDEGALFFDELMASARLLRTELEDALGELVAAGRITADSFAGLRALLMPAAKRDSGRHRRLRRHSFGGIEDAGRWSLVRASAPRDDDDAQRREQIEHVARTLLQRYGVVFWKLLEREASWLPSWRELRQVYQRLEARGEIRGGRFVDGLVGEQFALPEAIPALRAVQKHPLDGQHVIVNGCDPLNLVGTTLAGDRLPAVASTRILFEDGIAVAARVAGKLQWLVEGDADQQQRWRAALSIQGPASRAWVRESDPQHPDAQQA
ncbi:DEAD/DEAH box helicase [Dyella ginsengisoli]|uniref:DEAD/DEAH box helicase n=1 Tax=Dyella ginsengisoli TaxID=363848 RepID=A0ABW8JQG8_9GAMM